MIFFTDKPETFVCEINIEGASLNNTIARIIFESEKWTLVFYGNIDNDGKCKINIRKLDILKEGEVGKMKLEVIADDTLFVPWSDNFEIKTSKKVIVNVFEQKHNSVANSKQKNETTTLKAKVIISNVTNLNKEIPVVVVDKASDRTVCLNEIIDKLKKRNINSNNFGKNGLLIKNIILEIIKNNNIINKDYQEWITKSVLNFLCK